MGFCGVLTNFNFIAQGFYSKRFLKSLKKLQKHQNHTFTNHGVIWAILKLIKIHDQGMENDFFMLRFKICRSGVG